MGLERTLFLTKHSPSENETVSRTRVPLNMWAEPGFRGRPRALVKPRLPIHSDALGLPLLALPFISFSWLPWGWGGGEAFCLSRHIQSCG